MAFKAWLTELVTASDGAMNLFLAEVVFSILVKVLTRRKRPHDEQLWWLCSSSSAEKKGLNVA